MKSCSESRISAHHNYVVNGMPTPGFAAGDPDSAGAFFLLADRVLPGESTPRVSGRFFNEEGRLLCTLNWNRLGQNPGGCRYAHAPGGFGILLPSGGALLEVATEVFANGFLTRIKARLLDREGALRVEPFEESIRLHGPSILVLEAPFTSDRP